MSLDLVQDWNTATIAITTTTIEGLWVVGLPDIANVRGPRKYPLLNTEHLFGAIVQRSIKP